MSVVEVGIELARALLPPKTNDLDQQQQWRWVVFFAIIATASGLSLHIALACGWLPSFYPGFATSSTAEAVQRRVNVIATLSLEHEIRARELELCQERNQERRSELNDDIAKLQREYHEVNNYWYRIPGCHEL